MQNGSMSLRVTMADIAREAGVSVATVSKVLNGRTDVAAPTRRRVQELLSSRRYRPRRSRPARRAAMIELLFDALDDPWAVEIIRGVEGEARSQRMGVIISLTSERWIDGLVERGADGAIPVLSDLAGPERAQLRELGVPVVIVDPAGHSGPEDGYSVGATNWAGGLAATEHLVGLGHRRVAVISGPAHLLCSRARVDGYRNAMEAAGLAVDTALVRSGTFHHDAGFAHAMDLLSRPDRPTAIFAGNDAQAMGVYEAARQRGLRVPADLSVVGFDDLPQSRWLAPPLTTVWQPLDEMARAATRMLVGLLGGSEPRPSRVELATSLIVRESTAPPRTTR
jgi:DNA-binding LacI/PurR family transcriptional regulator